MSLIEIQGRRIGAGEPCYIIAEMSANHLHDYERAVRIVEAAKNAGADAIKLQTYTPDTLTIQSDQPWFRIQGTLWEGRSLYELYGEATTPWDWQPKLKQLADQIGIHLFSSPFDATAVDFLENMQVPAHKIASFEIVDLPLLRKVASTGKPVILSTGMATLAEIDEAVNTLRTAGAQQIALLKCTSAYPADPAKVNLHTIRHLGEAFGVPAGFSDHTLGIEVPIAAVSVGAQLIEKHMTLARGDGGPDGAFSLEPDEFAAMVTGIRKAEAALGQVSYGITEQETASRVFRRSLFVVADLQPGESFSPENLRSIRPGYGLHTRYYEQVLGKSAARAIKAGEPLAWEMVTSPD